MIDKIWFFILGAGIFCFIFNIITIIICNRKNKETKNADSNKCNVDFSDIRSELDALHNDIINMDLKYSQTNELTSHIYVIEHIIYRLENGDEWHGT